MPVKLQKFKGQLFYNNYMKLKNRFHIIFNL